ncbi:hypothetical protein PRJ39_08820 [Lysobacter enzymogenes]|uniref:hypothetical protein n=1 Tax=Lysobacter enzymogenes TaxID=69 RepID=UPI003749DD70
MAIDETPEPPKLTEPRPDRHWLFPVRKATAKALLELGRNFSVAVVISSVVPYFASSDIFYLPVWLIVLLAIGAMILSSIWVLAAVAHFFNEADFPTQTFRQRAKALAILVVLLLFGLMLPAWVQKAAKNSRFTEYCRTAWSDKNDPYNQSAACIRVRENDKFRRDSLLKEF